MDAIAQCYREIGVSIAFRPLVLSGRNYEHTRMD